MNNEQEKQQKNPQGLEQQLEECQKLKEEYLAGWKRANADFINFQKEENQRQKDILEFQKSALFLEIINIIDCFELAENNIPDNIKENDWVKGVMQALNQLKKFLIEQGVEEIKTENEIFNPDIHEAVEQVELEGKQSSLILETLQKGYTINSKLLRPSKVKVAK